MTATDTASCSPAPRSTAVRELTRESTSGSSSDGSPTGAPSRSSCTPSPSSAVTTCKVIAKAGYKIGDRVVRAAQVLVVDPASGPVEDVGGGTIDPAGGSDTGAEPEVRDDGE